MSASMCVGRDNMSATSPRLSVWIQRMVNHPPRDANRSNDAILALVRYVIVPNLNSISVGSTTCDITAFGGALQPNLSLN
jgi:hypothetical protein